MGSQREKMLSGKLYDPSAEELVSARKRAKALCHALAATTPDESTERRRLLTELLATGGDSANIEPPFHCDYGSNIELGKSVYFNVNCVVLDVCLVRIGDFSLVGPAVQIYTATHPLDPMLRRSKEYGRPVTIGSDVWLGGGSIILPGVTIGDRSVIGAGSVVTRDIPAGVVAVGNPCRVVRGIEPGR